MKWVMTMLSVSLKMRHREDSAALDLLQADYLWLDYQECIYRGSYTSKEQFMGGEVHSNDEFIERELTQLLIRLQEDLPMSSGMHRSALDAMSIIRLSARLLTICHVAAAKFISMKISPMCIATLQPWINVSQS